VRVAVQKLDGVDGVDVSLEEGIATIQFRPNARATVAQVARAIRDNGFTPKGAQVRIRGRVVERAGRLLLAVPGHPRPYPLRGGTAGAASADQLRRALNGSVELVGRMSEPVGGEDELPIDVVELTSAATGRTGMGMRRQTGWSFRAAQATGTPRVTFHRGQDRNGSTCWAQDMTAVDVRRR